MDARNGYETALADNILFIALAFIGRHQVVRVYSDTPVLIKTQLTILLQGERLEIPNKTIMNPTDIINGVPLLNFVFILLCRS